MSEHKNPAFPKKLFKIIVKVANHVKGNFKNKRVLPNLTASLSMNLT